MAERRAGLWPVGSVIAGSGNIRALGTTPAPAASSGPPPTIPIDGYATRVAETTALDDRVADTARRISRRVSAILFSTAVTTHSTEEYDMTQSQQALTGPAQANASVVSTGWTGAGLHQEAPGWCFAAAEQMVQRAFGTTITQAEIAHNILLARGRNQDPSGSAGGYYAGLRAINNQHDLANLNWATVAVYVRGNQTLLTMLETEYGNPPLAGRTHTRDNVPNAARIVSTIDAGGLVMIGDRIHWKIVYGYASGPTGEVSSYRVYNPWQRGTDTPAMSPASMSQGIEETYYVTA
jgi:hypothetical protein